MAFRRILLLVLCLPACAEEEAPEVLPPVQLTFTEIQTKVFDKGCAFNGCHGAARSGSLVLTAGNAYEQLVGVTPKNSAAQKHGWKRVTPGDPDTSYLMFKLRGPGEHPVTAATAPVYGAYHTAHADDGTLGDRMPPGSPPLSNRTIESIAMWIEAGAPND